MNWLEKLYKSMILSLAYNLIIFPVLMGIEKFLSIIIFTTVCLVDSSQCLKGIWFAVSGSPLAYSEEGVKRVVSKCS